MAQNAKDNKPNKIKQFLSGLIDKIDKKMEEDAKSKSCCCKSPDKKGNSCCS